MTTVYSEEISKLQECPNLTLKHALVKRIIKTKMRIINK